MKTAVLYYSETGNTKKIARALVCVFKQNAELIDIQDASIENIAHYDLIIIGTPIFGNNLPDPVKKLLLSTNLNKKNIALFYTHAAPMDSASPQRFLEVALPFLAKRGAVVRGTRHCRGENKNPEVLLWLKKNRPDAYKTAVTAKGKSDDTDCANAKSWVKHLY